MLHQIIIYLCASDNAELRRTHSTPDSDDMAIRVSTVASVSTLLLPSLPRISLSLPSSLRFPSPPLPAGNLRRKARSRVNAVASAPERGEGEAEDGRYVVVNFYRLVHVEDPQAEVSKHLTFLQGRDICGRIYLNEQGINAQYSGPRDDALEYVEWLKEDNRFSDMLIQMSPASNGHAFPRLKLRYKPSLIQLEGGVSHLPLVNPAMRATPLTPSEWKRRLQRSDVNEPCKDDSCDRKLLLLDVRNGYEWDIGHFQGAERPNVNCFRSTAFGLSKGELTDDDPLSGIDKERADILMYCTGGIRCDVYSTILRQKGFQNLYTLSGGVSNYLKSEGPAEWVGSLFVFDSRLSLPPSAYKSEAIVEVPESECSSEKSSFGRCLICGNQLRELRHRNCANIDCNLLYLSCTSCVEDLKGCCSLDCMSCPRLRPVLPSHQRYEKWYIYRDRQLQRM